MNVFLTRPTYNTEELAARLKKNGISLEVYSVDNICPREILEQKIAQVDGLITHTEDVIDETLLALASPNLKIIANMGIGFSNIDIDCACNQGITVTNTPTDEAFDATAEATVAILLSVARRIPALHSERVSLSSDPEPSFLRPTAVSVRNKTTGMIGIGRIGSRVARIMHEGFGNEILYYDAYSKPELEQELNACKVSLIELMSKSDFICINMPLNENSKGLVSADLIKSVKSNATIINTARAELIDEAALIKHFNNGQLHGIGLDVYSDCVSEITGENFALTSHFSNFEDLAYGKMTDLVGQNIVACLSGKPALTPVN